MTEWTKDEIESLISLPEHDQRAVIESLSEVDRRSLELAITEQAKPKSTYEKRREASNQANTKVAREGSTCKIPELSDEDRKRRAELEADSEAWIWEMCGPKSGITEPLTRMFTSQQSEMIGAYDETLQHGGDELLLASRGEGKTTYLRAGVWKSVSTGVIDFAAFVSATGDDAANSRMAIQDMIVRSEPFLRYYPEVAIPCRRADVSQQLANSMRATGKRWDSGEPFEQVPIKFQWSQKGMRFPGVPGAPSHRAMIQFRGADKAIRGLNIFGKRPQVVCIDDLDTPDTVNNPDLVKKVVDRVDLDIGGLGTPTRPVSRIFIATLPKQGIGVAHHYARQGHPFRVRCFKYLIEKPKHWEMWMEYVKRRQKAKAAGDKYAREAHRFYLDNREAMDIGAAVSNESRFNPTKLPDGTQTQVSAVQNYFDEWADKGEMYCRCELDNEIVESFQSFDSTLELGHVMNCEGDYPRMMADESTTMITRGVDVRKIELHHSTLATGEGCRNRVVDYDVRSHGTTETTVEQAEHLIYEALHELADKWESEGVEDQHGGRHNCDLVLIDKGWMGNWTEDGERKTWASQPVERFCNERGLRRYLPCKGAPNYRTPGESKKCIIGDNWHMNIGKGAERSCTEVIWNAEHWHSLVENLFMLPDEDEDRFVLPVAGDGIWKNHKRLAEHIREGSQDLAELRKRATRTRKAKYRRDHWWDAFAMMLLARSVEDRLREIQAKKRKPRSLASMQREAGA